MIKPVHLSIIFSLLMVSLCLVVAGQQPQQAVDANVGREDPFATLAENNPVASQQNRYDPVVVEQKPNLFVETVTLKFLKASSLKDAIKKMTSEYGSISIDTKSNSLIVCDTGDNLPKILAAIRRADKTPEQIMIEVVILDVQLDDDTEIGINWDILSDKMYDVGYRQNFTTRLGSTIEDATNIGNATAFNTTSAGGIAGNLSIISGTIRNVVHLIQQKRNVEILASPRVMVVSGQSANIEAVDEIPYQEISNTAEGGTLTYYSFKNVGVKLGVSATLTDGNDIFLTVDAEQNVQVGTTTPPRVDTRKAKASLLLRDGQVVVLGGLRRQEKTKEVDQIPILGDIPLLGLLFKSTETVVKNSELIVFLSPHIYKGEPMSEDEMAKFKEISERPVLSLPDDSKNSLRIPTNAEQKKNNVERKENNIKQKKKQSSKQKYPTSVE
jgi:type II secretory pathway component GspD/PulD (secretin)